MKLFLFCVGLTVVAAGLVGCGSQKAVSLGAPPREPAETSTTPEAAPTSPVRLQVWFARGDQLASEQRTHAATPRVATAAMQALLEGPSAAEHTAGVATAIPDGTRLLGISIKDRVATVDLTSEFQSGGGSLSMQMRLAQVVYTLTQFPTVNAVRFSLDGAPVDVFSSEGIVLDHPVGRRDYEDLLSGTAASTTEPLAGKWSSLARSPLNVDDARTSVWTGKELLVVGRHTERAPDGAVLSRLDVAGAYTPATNTWRRLPFPPGSSDFMNYSSAWTGKEMIVWGQGIRAAFNPATNSWRRIAPLPARRDSATAVWDGNEVLVVGGPSRVGFAYDPASNRWRRLPPMESPRFGAATVWTGKELLVWGGSKTADGGAPVIPPHGIAYDPRANRWSPLPQAPLLGRLDPTAVWTGRALIVWGGDRPKTPLGSGTNYFNDGAAFAPAR